MRTCLVLILLAGCSANSNLAALSVTPDATFVPTLDQAATLTYGDHVVQVNGLIGSFKINLKNTSDQKLTNVEVLVTANNSDMVTSIIFSRIYHTIFWGGGFFNFDGPTSLPDGTLLPTYPGHYAIFDGDDLDPGASVTFDSILLGADGLALYFQAYASLPDGTHYAMDDQATTVFYSY